MAGRKRNPAPPPQAGDNFNLNRQDLAEIEEYTREWSKLKADRAAINADMAAKKALIKAKGIDMSAWAASVRRAEMDPDDRSNFDRSQAMCNAALGIPIQGDLFGGNPEGASTGADDTNLPTIN